MNIEYKFKDIEDNVVWHFQIEQNILYYWKGNAKKTNLSITFDQLSKLITYFEGDSFDEVFDQLCEKIEIVRRFCNEDFDEVLELAQHIRLTWDLGSLLTFLNQGSSIAEYYIECIDNYGIDAVNEKLREIDSDIDDDEDDDDHGLNDEPDPYLADLDVDDLDDDEVLIPDDNVPELETTEDNEGVFELAQKAVDLGVSESDAMTLSKEELLSLLEDLRDEEEDDTVADDDEFGDKLEEIFEMANKLKELTEGLEFFESEYESVNRIIMCLMDFSEAHDEFESQKQDHDPDDDLEIDKEKRKEKKKKIEEDRRYLEGEYLYHIDGIVDDLSLDNNISFEGIGYKLKENYDDYDDYDLVRLEDEMMKKIKVLETELWRKILRFIIYIFDRAEFFYGGADSIILRLADYLNTWGWPEGWE